MEFEGSAEGYPARPIVIEDCGELDAVGKPIEDVPREDAGAGDDGLVLEEQ